MNELEAHLARLEAAFRRHLPARLAEIGVALSALRAGQGDWETAHRQVHSLVGSAGTLGLAEVSRRARVLERLMKAPARDGGAPAWDAIDAAWNELRAADEALDDNVAGAHSAPTALAEPAVILVAEDDPVSRAILVSQLEVAGHTVIAVDNGLAALERIAATPRPEIVLMDVMMPVMDGLQAVRRIREEGDRLGGERIPIIFLTADDDPKLLHEAIRQGGDDLLIKPSSPVILDAKIHALQRLSRLNRELNAYHIRTERELAVAEQVMRVSLSRNTEGFPGLRHVSRPAGRFSGDAVLYRRTGEVGYLMVADFTGHGLPAAVGTLIAADVFHDLAEVACPGEILLQGLNQRLYEHLPTDFFCAACLVEIQADHVNLWNRGFPSVWHRLPGGRLQEIPSGFLPLGVISEGFDVTPHTLSREGCLLVHTDGLSEACDADGKAFGESQVRELCSAERPVEALLTALERHLQGRPSHDDLTLVALDLGAWKGT